MATHADCALRGSFLRSLGSFSISPGEARSRIACAPPLCQPVRATWQETHSPDGEAERLSPFTERRSAKRRHGGVSGNGRTSVLEVDPLLKTLHAQGGEPTAASSSSPTQGFGSRDCFSPAPTVASSGFGFPQETEALPLHAQPDQGQGPESWRTATSAGQGPEGRAAATSAGQEAPEGRGDVDEANDISLRLPELREMLGLLRQSRGEGAPGEGALGKVFLVGTGPGDAELLTVKAWRLLQSADLVLYDRLVSRDVLDLIHPGARLLYVGKAASYHSRTQEEIHELLLSFAEAGASVVRLKGGDPLVFGRGGEEVEYLQARGIQVDIVPGITSASGIAANLGIPLTHRGLANSVRFLTGHSRKGGEDPLHVAENAADPDSTLVVYMGLGTLRGIVERLVANGLPASTPAVAVERGTTQWQRNVFSELADLPSAVERASLVSPTLVMIGQVVALSTLWNQGSVADHTASEHMASEHKASEHKALEHATERSSLREDVAVGAAREPRDRRIRGPDPRLPSERRV